MRERADFRPPPGGSGQRATQMLWAVAREQSAGSGDAVDADRAAHVCFYRQWVDGARGLLPGPLAVKVRVFRQGAEMEGEDAMATVV